MSRSPHPDDAVPQTSVPSGWDRSSRPDVPVEDPAALDLPTTLADVLAVGLDAAPSTRLQRLGRMEALEAGIHALRLATIASLSPVEEGDHWEERHVVEELRLAMRTSERTASGLLDHARAVYGGTPRPDRVWEAEDGDDTDGVSDTDDARDLEHGGGGDEDTTGLEDSTGPADDDGNAADEPAEQDQPDPQDADPQEAEPEPVAQSGSVAPFALMGGLLAAGLTSAGHVRALVAATEHVADDPAPLPGTPAPAPGTGPGERPWRSREDKLVEISTRARRAAVRSDVRGYRRAVHRLVLLVDGDAQTVRRAVAEANRRVLFFPREDGQATLSADGPALRTRQLMSALNGHAAVLQKARGGRVAARTDPDARIGACRYDALHAILTGIPATYPTTGSTLTDTPPEGPELLPGIASAPTLTLGPQRPLRLDGQLVIDARTLAGLAEHPGLLDGQPIPAPAARALALDVVQWRRLVTDPLTGGLLDYGTRQYTPDPLWRWVRARDGACTAPDCGRGLYRAQVDHRDPYPHGGSDRDNCGLLCTTGAHHQLKTAGWITVTDSHADGSMTWTTAWGQRIRTGPSVYLPGYDEWAEQDDGLPPEPPPAPPPPPSRPPRRDVSDEEPPF